MSSLMPRAKSALSWPLTPVFALLDEKTHVHVEWDSFYLLVATCSAGALWYTYSLLTNADNWEIGKDNVSATLNRGKFTSIVSMLTLGIFNMILDSMGEINGYTSAATMSILAGNMTGYVMDASLAGTDGWSKSKKGASANGLKWYRVAGNPPTDSTQVNTVDLSMGNRVTEDGGKKEFVTFTQDQWNEFQVTDLTTASCIVTKERGENYHYIPSVVGSVLKSDLSDCFKHGFASLLTYNGLRYSLTVLFDMHISSVFVEGIGKMSYLDSVKDKKPWKSFLPTFFSTIVSLTTFYAYTNETRFKFAIRAPDSLPDDTKDDNTIDSFTMFALVSTAAMTYLHTDVNFNTGVHRENIKALNVIVTFMIMAVMTQFKTIDKSNPVNPDWWQKGFAAYASVLFVLVVATFQTTPNYSNEELVRLPKERTSAKWGVKGLMIGLVLATILVPFYLLCTNGSGVVSFSTFVGLLAITAILLNLKGDAFSTDSIFRTKAQGDSASARGLKKGLTFVLTKLVMLLLSPYFVIAKLVRWVMGSQYKAANARDPGGTRTSSVSSDRSSVASELSGSSRESMHPSGRGSARGITGNGTQMYSASI